MLNLMCIMVSTDPDGSQTTSYTVKPQPFMIQDTAAGVPVISVTTVSTLTDYTPCTMKINATNCGRDCM